MASSVEAKRIRLSELYGPLWKDKVRRMTDAQVIAVYFKMLSEGKLK